MPDFFWIAIAVAASAAVLWSCRPGRHSPDGAAGKKPVTGERDVAVHLVASRDGRAAGSLLDNVVQAAASINRGVGLQTRLAAETSDLQEALEAERTLLDAAYSSAGSRDEIELRRGRMSDEQRRSYDQHVDELSGLFEVHANDSPPPLTYREPVFPSGFPGLDGDMLLAVTQRVDTLQAERCSYLKRVSDDVEAAGLQRLFMDEISRLTGPEAAEKVRAVLSTLNPASRFSPPRGDDPRRKSRISAEEIRRLVDGTAFDRLDVASPRSSSMLAQLVEASGPSPPHRALAIRSTATRIGVPHLIHFTALDNLRSILEHGVLPVSGLRSAGMSFHFNDKVRLDGQIDAVSLSIAHPNDRMFARCRWQDRERRWAVLVLSPSILWTASAAFNRHNAADARAAGLPLEKRMSHAAFMDMFSPHDDLRTRDEQNLRAYDPTDVQAEVLVFGPIAPNLIEAIVLDAEMDLSAAGIAAGDRRVEVHADGTRFLGARSFARRGGWAF